MKIKLLLDFRGENRTASQRLSQPDVPSYVPPLKSVGIMKAAVSSLSLLKHIMLGKTM